MPAKSNWVKGQTVTAADLNELAEAANNALSQEDADATYASIDDPRFESGGGGTAISIDEDPDGATVLVIGA